MLAIDGAGARTTLALPILEALETAIRDEAGDPALRLCDYFELLGGTGTGAVLAAALARGMDAKEARGLFETFTRQLFRSSGLLQRFTSRYSSDAVQEALTRAFGDEPLQSHELKSGLCIFTYRIEAESPFVLHNLIPVDRTVPPLRLADCLHASIASPTLLEPVPLTVSAQESGLFIDADVAMTGGAATSLFLAATAPDGPFQFKTGPENLLLVAVGAGRVRFATSGEQATNRNVLGWASSLPQMLLLDAARQNELFLRSIARCPLPLIVDEEMENVDGNLLPSTPALTYVRYDVDLSALAALGLSDLATQSDRLSRPDEIDATDDWLRIGEAVAQQQVNAAHFPQRQRSMPTQMA